MLSRVADSLYWMSRYLERTEHTARLIGVGLTQILIRRRRRSHRAGAGCSPHCMSNRRKPASTTHKRSRAF